MIYDITVKNNKGEDVSLSNYKGKVMLIVNTATQCGLTPQYKGLQKLHDKYNTQGLEILEFPCNQFFEQAPQSDDEIETFCTLNYATAFDRFAKIDVNGDNAHPLYKMLRSEAPIANKSRSAEVLYKVLASKGFESKEDEIKWNFTKFLVDRDGKVIARFAPTVKPSKLNGEIENLL